MRKWVRSRSVPAKEGARKSETGRHVRIASATERPGAAREPGDNSGFSSFSSIPIELEVHARGIHGAVAVRLRFKYICSARFLGVREFSEASAVFAPVLAAWFN